MNSVPHLEDTFMSFLWTVTRSLLAMGVPWKVFFLCLSCWVGREVLTMSTPLRPCRVELYLVLNNGEELKEFGALDL